MEKNIIGYVKSCMKTFTQSKFNDIDSLVLSQLLYMKFECAAKEHFELGKSVKIKELLKAEVLDEMSSGYWEKYAEQNQNLLYLLAGSPRFRDVEISDYQSILEIENEMQFAAATFGIEKDLCYVAFRGTDTSFVGWKEDFNMAFITPVPAQEKAVEYINYIGHKYKKQIRVGGHSKGGNLSIYAAMFCEDEIREQIESVYSHDGPGFPEKIYKSQGYKAIKSKIRKTIPQSSLVGLMLEYQEDYSVIKSKNLGIMQHNLFSWIVENEKLISIKKVKNSAYLRDKALNEWIQNLTKEEREEMVTVLHEILNASGKDFFDFTKDWQKSVSSIIDNIKNMNDETKENMNKIIKQLIKGYMKTVQNSLIEKTPFRQ